MLQASPRSPLASVHAQSRPTLESVVLKARTATSIQARPARGPVDHPFGAARSRRPPRARSRRSDLTAPVDRQRRCALHSVRCGAWFAYVERSCRTENTSLLDSASFPAEGFRVREARFVQSCDCGACAEPGGALHVAFTCRTHTKELRGDLNWTAFEHVALRKLYAKRLNRRTGSPALAATRWTS